MSQSVALLLAAGESRRMGQLKALLPWQGDTLLGHQISALRESGVDRVVVVLGHQADRLKPTLDGRDGVEWVLNPDYLRGKTTSIKAGLSSVKEGQLDALLILNVDQPRSSSTIRHLLEEHTGSDSLITIPTFGGKGGHPIILSPTLLRDLMAITEETQGIRAVVNRHQERTHRLEVETAEVLWDLNTPEQYQAALQG
jgi:molybdenum cofactor cytidylyltransferase